MVEKHTCNSIGNAFAHENVGQLIGKGVAVETVLWDRNSAYVQGNRTAGILFPPTSPLLTSANGRPGQYMSLQDDQ